MTCQMARSGLARSAVLDPTSPAHSAQLVDSDYFKAVAARLRHTGEVRTATPTEQSEQDVHKHANQHPAFAWCLN